MLSHPCQQTAIVSRQIRGALEGAIGPMVGILQDFAVFEPCPCIFRSDGKQRFDRLFGIIEPQELELDSCKNQAQFCASRATLHRRSSNDLSLPISKVLQQELGKREAGSGAARFCRDCFPQQIFGLHAQSRYGDPRWRRLRFQISSLLSQTGGERKPGAARCGNSIIDFRNKSSSSAHCSNDMLPPAARRSSSNNKISADRGVAACGAKAMALRSTSFASARRPRVQSAAASFVIRSAVRTSTMFTPATAS